MKAVLLAVGVLGLAAVFGLCEPLPASATPVTSDDVRLVSERMNVGQTCTRNKNGITRRFNPTIGRHPMP